MKLLIENLDELKHSLEGAAFLVCKDGAEKEAHLEIVKSLILVEKIRSGLVVDAPKVLGDPEADKNEVAKVASRLNLWKKRQNQINSRILNAYLLLRRSGREVITEEDLRHELAGEKTFATNFTQMKIIAEKNHGKVFQQDGTRVLIWEPVKDYVSEYEKVIFG